MEPRELGYGKANKIVKGRYNIYSLVSHPYLQSLNWDISELAVTFDSGRIASILELLYSLNSWCTAYQATVTSKFKVHDAKEDEQF